MYPIRGVCPLPKMELRRPVFLFGFADILQEGVFDNLAGHGVDEIFVFVEAEKTERNLETAAVADISAAVIFAAFRRHAEKSLQEFVRVNCFASCAERAVDGLFIDDAENKHGV